MDSKYLSRVTDVYFASYGCSNCCELVRLQQSGVDDIELRLVSRKLVQIADRSSLADRFDQSDRAHLIERLG